MCSPCSSMPGPVRPSRLLAGPRQILVAAHAPLVEPLLHVALGEPAGGQHLRVLDTEHQPGRGERDDRRSGPGDRVREVGEQLLRILRCAGCRRTRRCAAGWRTPRRCRRAARPRRRAAPTGSPPRSPRCTGSTGREHPGWPAPAPAAGCRTRCAPPARWPGRSSRWPGSRGPSTPPAQLIPSRCRTGPLTTISGAGPLVDCHPPPGTARSRPSASHAASTTGKYSGRQPARAAFTAACSTVHSRLRCGTAAITSSAGARGLREELLDHGPGTGTTGRPSVQPRS